MKTFALFLLAAACAFTATAQTSIPWDTSGNALLQGTYNFRQVAFVAADASGNLGEEASLYGTITFDGKGGYTVVGQMMDSTASTTTPQPYKVTGTYGIAASGLGYIDSLLITNEQTIGLVSQGVFTGSSTTSQSLNDFLVIVPQTTTATNATLAGNYWIGSMIFPTTDASKARDALFLATADGAGKFTGSLALSGYIGASGSTVVHQTIQNATYSFTNGTATLSFGTSSDTNALVTGDKLTYISPDGNFLVGGSATGYDIIIGVRAAAGSPQLSLYKGLYYIAGLDDDESSLASQQYAQLYTYYGSQSSDGNGTLLRHQEIAPFDSTSPYNYLTDDVYDSNSDGTFDQSYYTTALGVNGNALVAIGKGPILGVQLGLKAPTFSGTGPYIFPTGVVNAASSAPFTAGVAPGELVTVYGTNLAPSTAIAGAPFPATLNGVTVSVNGRPAPIYYVSAGQMSFVIPYATEPTFAQVQVTSGNVQSNTVTLPVRVSSPGVFTVPAGGVGYGAILHSNYTLVDKAHPAKAGETVQVFLTGLGDVSPTVADGAVGPTSPFSKVTDQYLAVYFAGPKGSVQGTITYAGLAPGLSGLYQVNVTLPSGVSSGDNYIEISGYDSYSTQALIPVQ